MSYLKFAKSIEEADVNKSHVLSLSGIDKIPKAIGSLKHLRTLFVEDCALKSLPLKLENWRA
jgi:hypothetical protein